MNNGKRRRERRTAEKAARLGAGPYARRIREYSRNDAFRVARLGNVTRELARVLSPTDGDHNRRALQIVIDGTLPGETITLPAGNWPINGTLNGRGVTIKAAGQ